MNIEKLKDLEAKFLSFYPNGYEDGIFFPTMKNFKPEKLELFAKENLKKENFQNPSLVVDIFLKIVQKSVLVSLFDKLKLKDVISSLNSYEKDMLSIEVYEFLHGNKKEGFQGLVQFLEKYKLAKWTIISVVPYYMNRQENYFIKPTTTKSIIKYLELENLIYKAKPSFEFYEEYSKCLKILKSKVNNSLTFDNVAFTGFLRISIESCKEDKYDTKL